MVKVRIVEKQGPFVVSMASDSDGRQQAALRGVSSHLISSLLLSVVLRSLLNSTRPGLAVIDV